MFENFGIQLVFGIALGIVTSVIAWLADTKPWSHKLLAYTIVISTISALGVINGLDGGIINDKNALPLILEVLGAGFIGNKSIQILNRIQTPSSTTSTTSTPSNKVTDPSGNVLTIES